MLSLIVFIVAIGFLTKSNQTELFSRLLGGWLNCAKLRIVELKIEDNKILGLNENWGEKPER